MARIKKIPVGLEMMFQLIRYVIGDDDLPEDLRLVEVHVDEKRGMIDLVVGANEFPECSYSNMGRIESTLDPERMHILRDAIIKSVGAIEDRSRRELHGEDEEPEVKVIRTGETDAKIPDEGDSRGGSAVRPKEGDVPNSDDT